MTRDYPLTGIGMGMMNVILPLRYPTFRIWHPFQGDHLHSLYMGTAAELGAPGIVALLAFLMGMLRLSWVGARTASLEARSLTWSSLTQGLFGTVVVLCVHGIIDMVTYYTRAHTIAWGMLGVAAGAAVVVIRDRPSDSG
jgi:hypothetical protein